MVKKVYNEQVGNVTRRKDVNVSRGRAILTNMKIKILIADDNSFIREGMKIILNTYEEFEVVDTVNDGEEAVAYCKSMKLILLF